MTISNEIDERLEEVYQKAGKDLDIKPHVLKGTLWWKKYCRMAYLQGVEDTNSQDGSSTKNGIDNSPQTKPEGIQTQKTALDIDVVMRDKTGDNLHQQNKELMDKDYKMSNEYLNDLYVKDKQKGTDGGEDGT